VCTPELTAVDVEPEVIGVLLARDLPPELERLRAARIDNRLQDRLLVVAGIAALGRVGVGVVVAHGRAGGHQPGRIPARGELQGRIDRLGKFVPGASEICMVSPNIL